ncbi:hypothetical protein Vi05172_g9937 [Venturia inaequalis]|nr:hypothetical protein Vi05172_g9937 [Venturia inaequalis]
MYRRQKQNKQIARFKQWEARQFKHNPLDEHAGDIRTVTLHPGTEHDEIEISIHHEHFTTQETPQYEALSYVWGSKKYRKTIKVRREGLKPLAITRSLEVALRHLRDAKSPRKMWIDAICIDQSNLEERGTQVQRMGEIYKRAERVVVWLGPEADESAHAMSIMTSLASKVEIDWATHARKPSLEGADEPHWADPSIELPYSERDWRALYYFLGRTWFERLWVRQEIAFSRANAIVLCGTVTMLWQDLRKANCIWMVNVSPGDIFSEQRTVIFHKWTRHIYVMASYRPSGATWQTLRHAGSSQCFDQRDKVYGNLGLIQESEGEIGLKPDYDQPVREVNVQLVLALLRFHRRLDILRCCELLDEQRDLPSWTPNWSITTKSFVSVSSDAFAPANAHYHEDGVLRVDGIVGGVLATTKIYHDPKYSHDVCSEIYRIAPRNVLREIPPGGGILLDSFCRALAGGEFRDIHPDREDYPTWKNSRQTVSEILRTNGGFDKSHDPSFLNGVDHYGHGRYFFTTEDGKMGWAPKTAKADDIVCVILGCEASLILREIDEARYQVVGECYMDGIMDGELVLGVLPENLRREIYFDRDHGSWFYRWFDTITGEVHNHDPRRAKFVKEGESIRAKRIGTSQHHPFLASERLKESGVNIRSFDLV